MSKSRVMYVEYKDDDIVGAGRIGRVSLSKTGRTLSYAGASMQSLEGTGYKANYFDIETLEQYWVSGCRKDGNDALYPMEVHIDEDVQEEYWREIRQQPEKVGTLKYRSHGKHSMGGRHTK